MYWLDVVQETATQKLNGRLFDLTALHSTDVLAQLRAAGRLLAAATWQREEVVVVDSSTVAV